MTYSRPPFRSYHWIALAFLLIAFVRLLLGNGLLHQMAQQR